MYKLGITGGIGSGKSTAANFFKKKGAVIFDADEEVDTGVGVDSTIRSDREVGEGPTDVSGSFVIEVDVGLGPPPQLTADATSPAITTPIVISLR